MIPIWVEEAVVIAIHRRQLAEHGGSDGIRDKGLLESALFRPKNQFNYGSPSIFDLAAAYGYGIAKARPAHGEETSPSFLAKNHPFIDGNKRTSYIVMRTFLKLNGYDIKASAAEKYEVWIRLADSQIDETDLSKWIESKSVEMK